LEGKAIPCHGHDADRGFVQPDLDTPLTTNTPVAYWAMQVADGELLVRFETDSTNLLFMGQRVEQAPDGGFCVISDGKVEEP